METFYREELKSFLYKMEIVNRVSAFQSYQNFSDVIAERMKQASEKRANKTRVIKTKW